MRIFSLVSLFTLGLFHAGFAQVDVLTARANPKTFIFDDDRHTVHGYIYGQLSEKTSCCGNDAIYLEVKFDESGTVTSAKTLTGKNDCYKQSVVDIVSSVRWDATDVKGSKTIYFEVKPIVACSGSSSENVYKKVPRVGGGDIVSTVKTTEPVVVEVKETPKNPIVETNVEVEVKEPVKEPVKEDDGFLSDAGGSDESSEVAEPVKPTKETLKNPVVVKNEPKDETQPVVATNPTPKKSMGTTKVPPQAKLDYVSRGELSPDPSHKETHKNLDVLTATEVRISGESQFGVAVRQNLRSAGFCGLAQALLEVEVDRNGNVLSSRVMYANNDKVKEILPSVVKSIKFTPPGADARSIFSYYQVKTEIVCQGNKPQFNLDQVPNVINKPAAGSQP